MIKVCSNKTKTGYRVCVDKDDYDSTSDMSLSDQLPNFTEKELTSLELKFGATVEYVNCTLGTTCTKAQYNKQFKKYDSDKCLILPVCTFKSKQSADKCVLKLLNK